MEIIKSNKDLIIIVSKHEKLHNGAAAVMGEDGVTDWDGRAVCEG